MDKYTVDLDQVLNEFEYNELKCNNNNSNNNNKKQKQTNSKDSLISSSVATTTTTTTSENLEKTPENETTTTTTTVAVISNGGVIVNDDSKKTISSNCNNNNNNNNSCANYDIQKHSIHTVLNCLNDYVKCEIPPVGRVLSSSVIDGSTTTDDSSPLPTTQPAVVAESTTTVGSTCAAGDILHSKSDDSSCLQLTDANCDNPTAVDSCDGDSQRLLSLTNDENATDDSCSVNGEEKSQSLSPVVVGFFNHAQPDVDDSELERTLNEYMAEEEEEEGGRKEVGQVEEEEDVEEEDYGRVVGEEVVSVVVQRPTTLPIDCKPAIDLIGGPGSTPFNNAYAQNASSAQVLPPPVSGSPTISELSTTETEEVEGEEEEEEDTTISSLTPSTDTVESQQQQQQQIVEGLEALLPLHLPAPSLPPATTTTNVAAEGPPTERALIGRTAPHWQADTDVDTCPHCTQRFTVLKRRHHCRACGLVLCAKCCHQRHLLAYLGTVARVCHGCFAQLQLQLEGGSHGGEEVAAAGAAASASTESQLGGQAVATPTAVLVPIGVLKKRHGTSNTSRTSKSVMFCDGIRPGSDLTRLDGEFSVTSPTTTPTTAANRRGSKHNHAGGGAANLPQFQTGQTVLPSIVTIDKNECTYSECQNNGDLVNRLLLLSSSSSADDDSTGLTFALTVNLYVHVKIVNLDCCLNKTVWCFTTEGLINIGQDEIVFLLEMVGAEHSIPLDVFHFLWQVYREGAERGQIVGDLGVVLYHSAVCSGGGSEGAHAPSTFLDCKNHAGCIFVRPTRQCLQKIVKPHEPFLVALLIHRWETPWAKLFPLRLVLRLGAEYRYYPVPIVSTRGRDSVFVEIGHTIINLLADFRNFAYTLPTIRGLTIHMAGKCTTVTIPRNRYTHVMKSLSNSSDHILALAGNFSARADSHLVCIQDRNGKNDGESAYSTHTIDIHSKPRKVIGASFIVFNGALKASSGLTAKSNVIEDGLMVQVGAEQLSALRDALKAMRPYTIECGLVANTSAPDETVTVEWSEPDVNFNVGVTSPLDARSLAGVPSIRTPNFQDFLRYNGRRLIRCTEVFILQNEDDDDEAAAGGGGEGGAPPHRPPPAATSDPVDVARISESIANATCTALVRYLDLLATTNGMRKLSLRVTLAADSVAYLAGSGGTKLPPIYMKHLDNELVPVLHRITSNTAQFTEHTQLVLEFIFRILYNTHQMATSTTTTTTTTASTTGS